MNTIGINTLEIIVPGVIVLAGVYGYARGFGRMLGSLLSSVLSLVLAVLLVQPLTVFLTDYTPLSDKISEACEKRIEEALLTSEETNKNDLLNLPLPENISGFISGEEKASGEEAIAQALNGEKNALISSYAENLSLKIARVAIWIITLLGVYIITWIALRIVIGSIDILRHLPLIGGIDRLAGLLGGFAIGILGIWIFYLFVFLFSGHPFCEACIRMTSESGLLTFISENNLLFMFFKN